MAGGNERFHRNQEKCKRYKISNTEKINRIKKLKKIIKGFKEALLFKVIETTTSAYIKKEAIK